MNWTLLLCTLVLAAPAMAQQGQQPVGAKVIKDPAEYNAYITALNSQDPAEKAARMEAFVAQYPASVVKLDALEQAMAAYQQTGNVGKVDSTARRLLLLDPSNARALAIVAFVARNRAAQSGDSTSGAEARRYGEDGLRVLATWQKPAGMADSDFATLRHQMASILHGAAGFGELQAKAYALARDHYLQAVQLDPGSMADTYQLAIACLEMNPIDPNGFWYVARAIHLAQGNAPAQESIAGYGKAKYRRYHGGDDGWDQVVAAAATETLPPRNFPQSMKAAPTPAELAVNALRENDPDSLSFSDWEFVLGLRDASPANREAADKVWRAIRRKEQQGSAKLRIPVKVVSATSTTIDAAITDENQQANRADVHVKLALPLAQLPAAGAKIQVVGVIVDYTARPFLFMMIEGELVR
jgi:hypothetical protein